MAPKVVIFAGAPDNYALDWAPEKLLDDFLEPIARFVGLHRSHQSGTVGKVEDTVLDIATWRSIPLERAIFETGFTQVHEFDARWEGSQQFFSPMPSQDTDAPSQSPLEEFYQHSLRVHDDLLSSQLPTTTFYSTGSSFDESSHYESGNDTSIGDSTLLAQGDKTLGLGAAHLSDLEDLPPATYLKSIEPQTMTVNLIVGIISIAEPRVVKTRWGTSRSLIELLVGDETRSGFSITFWLSDDSRSLVDTAIRALRRQDIVLLRNVGLAHFKLKVHGHSLRKGLTKVDLLYRRRLDDGDVRGFYSAKELSAHSSHHPQLVKTRAVQDWVLRFVGAGTTHLGKRKEQGKSVRSWELPPADTQ